MRLLVAALASTFLAGSAFAAEPEPKAKETTYTNEEISKALEFLGRPPLGSSRLLHDDKQTINRLDSVSKITIERR